MEQQKKAAAQVEDSKAKEKAGETKPEDKSNADQVVETGREEQGAENLDPIKNPNRLIVVYHTRIELLYMQQRTLWVEQKYEQAFEVSQRLVAC